MSVQVVPAHERLSHWLTPVSACRTLLLGGLKTGRKRLFVQEGGPFIQIEPVCVLDFYVQEEFQRQGVGFQLFEVLSPRHWQLTRQGSCGCSAPDAVISSCPRS